MANAKQGRPHGPPRLPAERRPTIPADGAIPPDVDEIGHDAASSRLLLGTGYIANVPAAVWNYEVSGKQVLTQWFSYRRRNRERPIIGDRRPPSPLGNIQPDHWLSEYTTELINLLNILALLVDLEPKQKELLNRILADELISEIELTAAGALAAATPPPKKKNQSDSTSDLFGQVDKPPVARRTL